MKKHCLSQQRIWIIYSILLMLSSSCQERGFTTASTSGRLIPVETPTKENNQFIMFCNVGHEGSNCKGCVTMNGQSIHVDCQGVGNVCRKSANVALSYDLNNNMVLSTIDTVGLTNLDFFSMPDVSLSLEIEAGVYTYLNIPSQIVYRDTTSLQFTFTGLSFTSRPLY